MRRQALLMIELLIALLILAITAGAFTLNANFWTVTPKREAERIFAKLSSLMLQADRIQTSFQLVVWPGKIVVQWNSDYIDVKTQKERFIEEITASKGCTYSWNVQADVLYYSHINNRYSQGATITVHGQDTNYYVVIATIGSRVRLSDTHP